MYSLYNVIRLDVNLATSLNSQGKHIIGTTRQELTKTVLLS